MSGKTDKPTTIFSFVENFLTELGIWRTQVKNRKSNFYPPSDSELEKILNKKPKILKTVFERYTSEGLPYDVQEQMNK